MLSDRETFSVEGIVRWTHKLGVVYIVASEAALQCLVEYGSPKLPA